MAKMKIWLQEDVVKDKSDTCGRYYINVQTLELIYQAEKRDRRLGISHVTDSLAIDVKGFCGHKKARTLSRLDWFFKQ